MSSKCNILWLLTQAIFIFIICLTSKMTSCRIMELFWICALGSQWVYMRILHTINTRDRDRNNFLFLADQTRCAQTKDLPKIESYFGHDPLVVNNSIQICNLLIFYV